MKLPENAYERYVILLDCLNWKSKVLKFPELIELYKDESLSPENIFLLLYKTEIINSFKPRVEELKSLLESQLPCNFNDVRFTISEKGIKVLEQLVSFYKDGDNKEQSKIDSNVCSNLEIFKFESRDFDEIFGLQKLLQEKIGVSYYDPDESLASIAGFFMKNKHALEEELSETITSIGGMHDGIGSAVWKWWKKEHAKAHEMKLSDLSERDMLELKFEIVDQFHFLVNQALRIGMTGSELFSMFISKNQENINRQNNGY